MPSPRNLTSNKRLLLPRAVVSAVVGLFVLGLLAAMPGVWALPAQAPDFQTVPTLTPTRPSTGATETPAAATDTPVPPPGATATNTPLPPPGATTTNTPTPPRVTATNTPTRTRTAPLPAAPVQSGAGLCWTVPTPGFVPERALSLKWTITSDQFLVTPGQIITQRLLVENTGTVALPDALICNPLDPDLAPGKPTTTQGVASMEPEGLLVRLGDLAAGQTARVELSLRIPPDYPLGGVIESQAWLFTAGQRASTDLLTWALPPAYLPPTGR